MTTIMIVILVILSVAKAIRIVAGAPGLAALTPSAGSRKRTKARQWVDDQGDD